MIIIKENERLFWEKEPMLVNCCAMKSHLSYKKIISDKLSIIKRQIIVQNTSLIFMNGFILLIVVAIGDILIIKFTRISVYCLLIFLKQKFFKKNHLSFIKHVTVIILSSVCQYTVEPAKNGIYTGKNRTGHKLHSSGFLSCIQTEVSNF
ncbi:hypothetical protein KUTeg_011636 [Tegillarca granosa]|uniref:Uncharacterized protein n=1 Tax=Tegillarca granosa TaxID=220873 RepID=A0ABQ9EX78_TEGGR|nr:hypothetical protein KUTeg_011636 [Tegillarca granosa]